MNEIRRNLEEFGAESSSSGGSGIRGGVVFAAVYDTGEYCV